MILSINVLNVLLIILYKAKGFEESNKLCFTNSWAVHIQNGTNTLASNLAVKHGFENFGPIGSLPGYFQFVHRSLTKRRKRREVSKTVTLLLEDKIQWVEQQVILERDKRSIIPDYIDVIHPNGYSIQDPLYSDQWYLNNIGQSTGPSGLDINILPVWSRGVSGKGVVVAILDDGLDHSHPDLKANYDPKASYDFNDYDEDPMPRSSDPNNCHGTKCAGEVAAEAGNGVCGVGVAFNSSIGGIRMLDGNVTDTIEGSALSYHKDYIDIYSCAWGPKDDGKRFGRPGTLASKALELGVKEGRNGLGSLFVWATGNGGLTDDDCNCDGYTTSVFTVSIGAISDHGLSTYYTESCASTLAVTYSGGSHREKKENKIITTTLGHKCTDEFKGTSAAAPLAAGMVALVLETNPNVTWRDVQHIIVETSVMSSPLDEGWRRNGAGKWFNQKFGFGRMDAAAMVEKASTWSNVNEQRNCWSDKSEGPWIIPSSGTLLVAMNTTACSETSSSIKTIEHVQIVMSLEHRRRGHLSIELISPSGTRTQLLKTRRNDRSTKGLKDWVFMSVHFWGEDPRGSWTLAVSDNNHNDHEHHLEKTKYGDMEDATGMLQDMIEDKEDSMEHEKIVEDDDLFKSAEEFENRIFKDDTYLEKVKKKVNSKALNNENKPIPQKERGESDVLRNQDADIDVVKTYKTASETNSKKKETSNKQGWKEKSLKLKKSEKTDTSQPRNRNQTQNKKTKKKISVEEDAEEKIVEELLKESKSNFQNAVNETQSHNMYNKNKARNDDNDSEHLSSSVYSINAGTTGVSVINMTTSSNYNAFIHPAFYDLLSTNLSQIPVEAIKTATFSSTVSTARNPTFSSSTSAQVGITTTPFPTTRPMEKVNTSKVKGNGYPNVTSISNHTGVLEENNSLEAVLRNVLTEVFTNFKQEDKGYKILAERIEGLENALQDKNKTQRKDTSHKYSSLLSNALSKGKPIDKIKKVLDVLEDRSNLTERKNSSFSTNVEVVTDVLKVLKDILSTSKDDKELKLYKTRITKLLERSSNGTRQLTEKLFSDIEPSGEEKGSSTNVIGDALTLISHVFQKNKNQLNNVKVSKDLKVSLKPSTPHMKDYDKLKDRPSEVQPNSFKISEPENDYDPLPDILLHGEFLKDGQTNEKDDRPIFDNEHTEDGQKEYKMKENVNHSEVDNVNSRRLGAKSVIKDSDNVLPDDTAYTDKNEGHIANNKQPLTDNDDGIVAASKENPQPQPFAHGVATHDLTYKITKLQPQDNPETHEWHKEIEMINSAKTYKDWKSQIDKERDLEDTTRKHELNRGSDGHDDDTSDFTIAVMKGGKKIGERKVNEYQANRYLVKPQLPTSLGNSQNSATLENGENTAILRGSLYNYNDQSSTIPEKQYSSISVDDSGRSNILEYKKLSRKYDTQDSKLIKDLDFDVTRFALDENRFTKHSNDDRNKNTADDVTFNSALSKDHRRLDPSITQNLSSKKDVENKELNQEEIPKEDYVTEESEEIAQTIRQKSKGETKSDRKEKHSAIKKHKKPISHKSKDQRDKLQESKRHKNIFLEHYIDFNGPLPLQIPDPSQFPPINVPSVDGENFIQPFFDTVTPDHVEDIINVPVFQENAQIFEEPLESVEMGDKNPETVKRSDISYPSRTFSSQIIDVKKSRIENDKRLLRIRRYTTGMKDVATKERNLSNLFTNTLFAKKKDLYKKRKHPKLSLAKDRTIFFLLHSLKGKLLKEQNKPLLKTPYIKENERKRSSLRTLKTDEKVPKESSSVLNIIKRVHDDIAIGNSRDLRRLESELATLEGVSKSDSNEQINAFEKLARLNTVRAKVSKKYKEDPDEYYKYGATASGKLESWTLHFYGTGV